MLVVESDGRVVEVADELQLQDQLVMPTPPRKVENSDYFGPRWLLQQLHPCRHAKRKSRLKPRTQRNSIHLNHRYP